MLVIITVILLIIVIVCAHWLNDTKLNIETRYGIVYLITIVLVAMCVSASHAQATQTFGKPIDITNLDNINVGFETVTYKATKGSRAFVEYVVTITHPTKPFPLLKHLVDKGQFDLTILHNVDNRTANIMSKAIPKIIVDGSEVLIDIKYTIYLPSKTTISKG